MDVGSGKGGVKSDINVIPLADIMLVLLIIMMLVAPLLQQGVSVTLPIARNSAEKGDSQDNTVIAIGRKGELYVNAQPVSQEDLAERVSSAMEQTVEKIIVIRADTEVEYGAVMSALDQLRTVGIENIGLMTDRPPTLGGSAGGR
jgi:biopolymer transport protein ExbD